MNSQKQLHVMAAVIAAMAGSSMLTAGTVTARTAGAANTQFGIEYASREAALAATSTQVLPVRTYTSSVAGVTGDRITVTLGGTAGAQFSKNSTNAATLDTGTANFGRLRCTTAPGGAVPGDADALGTSLTQISGTATTRVFEVPAGIDAGTCKFDSATLLNTSLRTAGTITIEIAHTRAGSPIDSGTAAVVADVANQFRARVVIPGTLSALDATDNRWQGVIDNGANSKAFTNTSTAGGLTTTDTLLIDIDNNTTPVINDATLDTGVAGVLTIGGDFNYLVNGSTDSCATPTLATGTPGRNRVAFEDVTGTAAVGTLSSASCSSIQLSLNSTEVGSLVAAADDLAVKLINATTGNFLSPQSFSASFDFKYSTASSALTQTASYTLSAGSQTASGVRVFVPYLPIGSGISQILYVTNNSATAGSITMTSRNTAGTLCSAYPTVTVGASRVYDLSSVLATGLAACGGAAASDKLAITITSELPAQGLEVYSAYNIGGNRVNVVNSSNGRSSDTGVVGSGNATR
jgi:hypothetical protein